VSANEYPIDTSGLDKGSTITAEDITRATGVKPESKDYWKAQLRIKGYVVWRLSERQLDVVVCSVGPDLHILTDIERARYTDKEFVAALVKAGRRLQQQAGTDRSALPADVLARHDRALSVNGATYAGMRKARKVAIVAARPRERLTPGVR
jgi:hypothetical protein